MCDITIGAFIVIVSWTTSTPLGPYPFTYIEHIARFDLGNDDIVATVTRLPDVFFFFFGKWYNNGWGGRLLVGLRVRVHFIWAEDGIKSDFGYCSDAML